MPQSLSARVAEIESQMQTLRELPGQAASLQEGLNLLGRRVESIDTRLTTLNMRVESIDTRLMSLEAQFVQFRTDVKDEFSAVRQEIRAGDEETRRYMRVLHEEVIARIRVIGER